MLASSRPPTTSEVQWTPSQTRLAATTRARAQTMTAEVHQTARRAVYSPTTRGTSPQLAAVASGMAAREGRPAPRDELIALRPLPADQLLEHVFGEGPGQGDDHDGEREAGAAAPGGQGEDRGQREDDFGRAEEGDPPGDVVEGGGPEVDQRTGDGLVPEEQVEGRPDGQDHEEGGDRPGAPTGYRAWNWPMV